MNISYFILPFVVVLVVLYAAFKKVSVYDAFVEGAKESFEMILNMFPTLLAMIFGVNIFLKSNILSGFLNLIHPILTFFCIPKEIVPMALVRPISGSSSLAILNDILSVHSPDSYIGRLSSVLQGSTDTTFYILTLYFGSIGITKIKHSLWAGLIADVAGIIASLLLVNLLFY
ncbi:MAG: spore maturation protein [Bacilli bacterium]|nr:spore maturation protein [Bacilli bacterium]